MFSGAKTFVKFGRRHYEEQFYEVILNLDWCLKRRCILKMFLIWGSGGRLVQWSRTICAILVEGIMRNNSLNLYRIWASGSGGDVVKVFLFWSSGGSPVQWSKTICAILKGGMIKNINVLLF